MGIARGPSLHVRARDRHRRSLFFLSTARGCNGCGGASGRGGHYRWQCICSGDAVQRRIGGFEQPSQSAECFRDGRLSEAELRALSDDEAIGRLTGVKGVGPWTAKGALLIAHQRPDLVRADDVALRRAIQVQYGLDQLPTPDEVADLARRWAPFRSLASSLLLAAAQPKTSTR